MIVNNTISRITTIVIFCVMATAQVAYGQKLTVKSNLLYGGLTLTPNLGAEIGLGRKTTLDLAGSYNPWNLKGGADDNKKLVHWMAQAEFRYWTCQRFNGSFFGVHALYSDYNIGKHKLPMLFGSDSEKYRYEGNAVGGGISYGYQWLLGKRWSLEATVGVGVVFMKYSKYECPLCGEKIEDASRTYFGPTRAGISLIYVIK